jgi:transcriptional regulator with XRE-family HTH domain
MPSATASFTCVPNSATASSLVMAGLLAGQSKHVKRPANIGGWHVPSGSGSIQAMTTIGFRVRLLRKKRGLTQASLAQASGITQGSLSLIETDRTEMPAGATLAALCATLRTTPDFLVAGGGDPDSIDSAIQEHELVFLWRDLPEDARRLVLENAHSVRRAFGTVKTAK